MRCLLYVGFLLIPSALFAASDIPRFQKVADNLYRGGQPDRKGFEFLKKEGIRTVVNLRDENDEEQIVKDLGIRYVHLPMSVKPWSKVSESDLKEFFAVLDDPSQYPIFVHCRRGADRTGVMIGFYRVAAEGWDGNKAVDEARKIGMRWWFWGLKSQLKEFVKSPSRALLTLKPIAETLD